MKISLNWLNEFVDVSDFFESPQNLADLLTKAGLEVEELEDLARQFKNVVIGSIIEKSKHPQADRLSFCQVSTGDGVVHEIVCGATNHQTGDCVVVALPGAILPGEFEIKKSKIRGVESSGMLCSYAELGLEIENEEKSEGIIILPKDVVVGQSYSEYMGFNDIVFDLKVTPNRSDCLSHFGLAREISSLLARPLKKVKHQFQFSKESSKKYMNLSVSAAELCPRYSGRVVLNVKVGPSPIWMKNRLESLGIHSINNIVDITNYVMLEFGQPLHAFDLRFIEGKEIIVRKSNLGEMFVSLDGTEMKLAGDELVICDTQKVVALAGVVGGKNSGIQDDTTDVFIESAYFIPSIVRKTSRRLGIETDSAYRFSRGVDPEGTLRAMNRAAQLMFELAQGKILGDHHDFYPHPVEQPVIETSLESITLALGYEIKSEEVEHTLKQLNCQVKVKKNDVYEVIPPAYRCDLLMEVDLFEEVGRLLGYDRIPERLPLMNITPKSHSMNFNFERQIVNHMQEFGFLQAVNYAFYSEKFANDLLGSLDVLRKTGLIVPDEPVRLINPLNEELNVMRTFLTPSLVKNVAHNCRHGISGGQLFEVASVFSKNPEGEYKENFRLGLSVWGQEDKSVWKDLKNQNSMPTVFKIKSAIENLLFRLRFHSFRWENFENPMGFLHPGRSAILFVENNKIGFVGDLNPIWCNQLDIRFQCAFGEIDLDRLSQGFPRSIKAKSISRFPVVERDIAFVMPEFLPAGDIVFEMYKKGGKILKAVFPFDVYQGENLDAGQKSVTYRLIFQDNQATLSENQILDLQKNITNAVCSRFSISVR